MAKNGYNRLAEEGYEREVHVDDQCCKNCRYWCDWDPMENQNGCKNYGREDYERKPKNRWCVDWKGKRGKSMSTDDLGDLDDLYGMRGMSGSDGMRGGF